MRRHAKAVVAASALLLLTMALGVNFATATAPTVSIDAPTSVSYTSAHVSGKVDPEDQETSYRFEYSTDPSIEWGWQWTSVSGSLLANSGEATVEGEIEGLSPNTQYFVRLVAENADGQTVSAEPYPTFTTDAVAPATVSIDAPTALTSSSAHFSGTVNPEAPGGNPAAFDVNWRFECTPECPDLVGGTIPADSSNHTVEADTTGLKPGQAYEVKLIATNAGGSASATESFAAATAAPTLGKVEAAPLSTEAMLQAQVNPGGLAATYYFEYGPTAAYGQSSAVKNLSAASDPVPATATLSGLTPGATYHYRVVVANALGTVTGLDQSFTALSSQAGGNCPNEAIRAAQNALALGNCRALEMVSPADKNGGDITLHSVQSTPEGNGITFQSTAAFAGSEAGAHIDAYVAHRGAETWQTKPITPYQTPEGFSVFAPTFGPELFSADLNKTIFLNTNSPDRNSSDPSLNQRLLWLRDGSGYRLITPPASSPSVWTPPKLVGASTDKSRIYFQSVDSLTADAPPAGTNAIYEWADGNVRLASVLPNGSVAEEGVRVYRTVAKDAVSPDGSQVVFEAGSPRQVYLRTGAGTVEVSASQKAGAGGDPAPGGATFVGSATTNGSTFSEIFFVSRSELTDDANTGPSEEGQDLYSYDVASGVLTDLTPVSESESPNGANVQYDSELDGRKRFNASADGSYLYFVANGKLTPDSPSTGNDEQIYVEHEGSLRYISLSYGISETIPTISPDGRSLAFTAYDLLAGYPADARNTVQVFNYEYGADTLTCVSCPAGKRPTTKGALSSFIAGEASYPLQYTKRNFTTDGSLFFESGEQLDPRDSNGKIDVYQWSNGRATLISPGTGSEDAHFVDASVDGSNVYFGTRSALIANDPDKSLDLYDARINGGLPLPPVPGAPCEGDACQTPARAPADSTPGSAGFRGAGNEKPRFANARKKKKQKQRKKKRARTKQAKNANNAKQGKKAKSKPSTRRHG